MALVDLEKAFDKVNWKWFFMSLWNAGISWNDRRFIFNLYKNQTKIIDVNGYKGETDIRQGVRPGCPILSYIFNVFIEPAINEMKVNINGIFIK